MDRRIFIRKSSLGSGAAFVPNLIAKIPVAKFNSLPAKSVFNWPTTAKSIKITTSVPITSATALDYSILLGQPEISRVKGLTEIKIKKPAEIDPFATVLKLQIKAKSMLEASPRTDTTLNVYSVGNALYCTTNP